MKWQLQMNLKNAVTQDDVRLVRIMIKDSMVVDPTFTEFDQMMLWQKL